MSSPNPSGTRGRTKVVTKEPDSDSETSDVSAQASSDAVPEKFKSRTRVNAYQQSAEFPLPPLFAVNEIVYLIIPGQNQPAGPFVVSASLDNKRYRIRRQDNGQEHPTTVTEERMVVPAT